MPILDRTGVHRIILVNANRRDEIRTFIRNNADLLDPLGGDDYFVSKLALIGDPDDGSVVRAYAAGWHLPQSWWVKLSEKVDTWKVNTTDADNDASHYRSDNWSLQQVLDDTTRKPFALKVVPVES